MAQTGLTPAASAGHRAGPGFGREAFAAAARRVAAFRLDQTWILSSALVVGTGLVVLVGWFTGAGRLTSVFPGAVSM